MYVLHPMYPTPWPPTCACYPTQEFILESDLCFHRPEPRAQPGSWRPRCSQTATGQAWGGSQGREGPAPIAARCPRLRPRCLAAATLSWQGKRSHLVFSHTNPGTTHRLSQRQAPSSPSHFTSQDAAPDRAGRCMDPTGAERARAAVGAGQTPLWPGVELCHSLKTHALSGPGRQLCIPSRQEAS